MKTLRDRLEARLCEISPAAVIFGAKADRLPNTTLIALPGGKAETLVIAFDLDGVAVSSALPARPARSRPRMYSPPWGLRRNSARGGDPDQLGAATYRRPISTVYCKFGKSWRKNPYLSGRNAARVPHDYAA